MKRQLFRRCAVGAAAALLGLGLLVASGGTADAATTTPAAASIATLMKSYDSNSGRIGGGWWTGAVALSTVMTYRQTTGDSQYDYAITGAWDHNKATNFENQYLDDTGWWALVWIQAYDITGNTAYLQMAQTDAAYMHNYWDSQCGGGIYWSTAKAYKASIANELFLAVTAGLHNRVAGDTTYGGWATAEWNWFNGSGLVNGSHLVIDGINTNNCSFNTATFTYNQGVVLQGLIEQSKATGNTGLLTTARSIATAGTQKFNRNGVLYEGCEPNCAGDGQAFKGIFIRYLRALANAAHTTDYDTFITTTANSILAHDTNSAGQQGDSFIGPPSNWSYITQSSAAAALVAAIGAARPIRSGIAGYCLDVTGGGNANGTKLEIYACNGTGAQNWTLASDGSLQALGKCADVNQGGTANGSLVQLWDCNGSGAQRWTYSAGSRALVNPQSGRCLDDPGGATNGSQLVIWDCGGGVNQQWTLSAPVVGSVTGYAGKCADVNAGSNANGTAIQIWDCNNSTAQQWTVAADGTLQAVGKCMDVAGGGTANGTKVQLWDCNGSGAQQWTYNAGTRVLVNPQSGRCLDDPGSSTTNGTQLDIWDCNNGVNQQWNLP